MHKHSEKLKRMGACESAVEWADQFDTLQEAWDSCERGDWMLWLLGKLSGPPQSKSRKKLVFTSCKCARLAWPYVQEENRPVVKRCLETAESWAQDKGATLEEVIAVANDAYISAKAAKAAYAAWAANAAAEAARAVTHPLYAAWAAAYVAYATAYAAALATQEKILKKCAEIVYGDYPHAPKL